MDDEMKHNVLLRHIAEAAAEISKDVDPIEIILEGIRRVPEQLQMMVDSIVAMQDKFPMPEAGWNQFVKDIQYTNEKHGLNLVIKEERWLGLKLILTSSAKDVARKGRQRVALA